MSEKNISSLSEKCLKRFLFYSLIDSLIDGTEGELAKEILKITALEKEYEELKKLPAVQKLREKFNNDKNHTIDYVVSSIDRNILTGILKTLEFILSRCGNICNEEVEVHYPQQKNIRRYSEGNIRTDWESFSSSTSNKGLQI